MSTAQVVLLDYSHRHGVHLWGIVGVSLALSAHSRITALEDLIECRRVLAEAERRRGQMISLGKNPSASLQAPRPKGGINREDQIAHQSRAGNHADPGLRKRLNDQQE